MFSLPRRPRRAQYVNRFLTAEGIVTGLIAKRNGPSCASFRHSVWASPFARRSAAAETLRSRKLKARAPCRTRDFHFGATIAPATGKLTVDQCGQAIDAAVALHEAEAPSYGSLSQCAATVEGPIAATRASTDATVSACKRSSSRWRSRRTPSRSTRRLESDDRLPVAVQAGDRRHATLRYAFRTRRCLWPIENAKLANGSVEAAAQLGRGAADIH